MPASDSARSFAHMTIALGTEPVATTMAGQTSDWLQRARELGPGFAARAAAHDANDSFPFADYAELKLHGFFSAAVPAELGGGGASHMELCAMLRELGRHAGATALAFSMHTHLVATSVWLWRQGAPVAPLLQRIAALQPVLVTNGASDWLDSNGVAERVDGGFRVTARKAFTSGAPAGDLLLTSAVYDDPSDGATVLHFTVPLPSEGVTRLDNWYTMGMRASGSSDILLHDVFVPDAAVSSRRPQGVWDPFFNVIGAVAVPMILSVYTGIAEAARDLALERAARKRDDADVWYLVGDMENQLVTAQLAVRDAIAICGNYTFAPTLETFDAVVVRKTIAAQALLGVVENAMELSGGAGYFRSATLERLVRDMHALRYHPMQPQRQRRLTGRLALGLDPNGISDRKT